MSNQLAQATSPYLLAHKDNPVNWRLWGEAALEEARTQGKPILLSIGYTACHWCHVMNEESFEDPQTAELINAEFIPIKVDREQRPDVDQLYQASANMLGHSGGWPLTMFLTATAEPFFAASYLPKEERYGTPSFTRVLSDVARSWREQQQDLLGNAARVREGLSVLWASERRGPLNNGILDAAAVKIGQAFDIFYGGITGAQKFPAPHLLDVMWNSYLRTGLDQFSQVVLTSLHNICMGGVWDHVGGGFARYSADERWTVPHFEKMLYDQALMIDQLVRVAQFNQWPLFIDRIHETVRFLLRDMRVGDAFAACFDADSEGEEGKYYVWSEAEIDAALKGTFSQRFKEVYNVTHDGNFNGKNVLHRLGRVPGYPLGDADETLFARQRALLLEARSKRKPPQRDDQILTDWNGMAIAALARAGAVFKQSEWLATAQSTFDFISSALADGDHLSHSLSGNSRSKEGFADDYAHMIRAALQLFDATQDARYLERAKAWTRVLDARFWDPVHGGYCTTASDDAPLFIRPRMIFDQVTPSANGVMIGELTRLFLITADTAYRDRLNAILTAFAGELGRASLSMPTYLSGFEAALLSLQIVIVGPSANAKTRALVEVVRSRSLPPHVLLVVPPAQKLPQGHVAYGKTMLDGEPTAYVCQNTTCSAPVTDPAQLAQQLLLPAQLAMAMRARAQAAAAGQKPN